MIPNGTIKMKTSTGGGMNENGDPIPVIEVWGEDVPCRFSTNRHNTNGKYVDGQFIIQSYSIIIALDLAFKCSFLELFSMGVSLGKFDIQDLQFLTIVGRIKIVV